MTCPACRSEPLVELDLPEGARVELCGACKGMLLGADALERLAGGSGVHAATEPCDGALGLLDCLRCNTASWQARSIPGAPSAGLYACGMCGMVWLLPGELDRLRARLQVDRWRSRVRASAAPLASSAGSASGASVPSPSMPDESPLGEVLLAERARAEPIDRISFEHGASSWLGPPVAFVLGLVSCSTEGGRFFGALVGMPFHELGHALTSWLSSRFALPLPFFTLWLEEQSVLFGLVVAGVIGGFGLRSWLEQRRFGVALAFMLLVLQVGMSWLVPARSTLMLQILGGALGEIVLGGFVLVAFYFPLPDRLRWDFWRWPLLAPGSICLAHALLLWSRAVENVRHMPWGSAVGSESDGDMNRLVSSFGWKAPELASFYLKATWGVLAALALAVGWAWHRSRRAESAALVIEVPRRPVARRS
jgi:hypothetical protein